MEQSKIDYLDRSLARIARDAVEKTLRDQQAIVAAQGLGNSRTILAVRGAYEKDLTQHIEAMVSFAHDVCGESTPDAVERVRKHADTLQLTLQTMLQRVLERAHLGPKLGETSMTKFRESSRAAIDRAIDDFQHGMRAGAALTRPPKESVISILSAINSPGAVQQAGSNNVQTVQNIDLPGLRVALERLASSKEVADLEPDRHDAMVDMVETMIRETKEASPDNGRLVRWWRRLSEAAQQFGVGVAVEAVAKYFL